MIRKVIGEREAGGEALLHRILSGFGWAAVEGGVTGFSLCKFERVERRAVFAFEELKIARIVHDANGHGHVPFGGLGLGSRDDLLDSREAQVGFHQNVALGEDEAGRGGKQ